MKRYVSLLVLGLMSLMQGWSMGGVSSSGVSILLVPAKPNLVQVGRDLATMGKAVMVSYATNVSPSEPFLHIWGGEQWLPVSGERFTSGNFLRNTADQVIVVGPEDDRTAFLIETALGWCPEVLHMSTLEVTPLINQLGKVYDFSKGDWEWLAERYQLQLTDLTADTPRESWYETHQPSDVPRTPPPWRKSPEGEALPPPSTSLSPVEEAPASP